MTREKKEILKKIYEIQNHIAMEEKMGCGFSPSEFFDKLEQEYLNPLYEKLATLQHYNSVEDMLHDDRGCY